MALATVAGATAVFAWAFRAAVMRSSDLVFGSGDPVTAARRVPAAAVVVGAVVAVAVALAAGRAATRHGRRHGMPAIGEAVRGHGEAPPLGVSMRRAAGTWIASSGLLSIGRESAILETGGAIGSVAGRRRLRRLAPALVAGGVAAAFAAAYHAPIAGAVYVAEHLHSRRDARTLLYSTGGALAGYLVAGGLGADDLLAAPRGTRAELVVLASVGLVPAVFGSRLFLVARERIAAHHGAAPAGSESPRDPTRASVGQRPLLRAMWLATAAVASIVVIPLTAGNGMDALDHASINVTLGVALALAIAKLVATTAALGAGVPGGAFWASLAVPAGWALLTFLTIDAAGFELPGAYWDGMLAAMVVGIAVGMRSPLVATFAVAEMIGDLSLTPIFAAIAFAAAGADRLTRRRQHVLGDDADVRDEDA